MPRKSVKVIILENPANSNRLAASNMALYPFIPKKNILDHFNLIDCLNHLDHKLNLKMLLCCC